MSKKKLERSSSIFDRKQIKKHAMNVLQFKYDCLAEIGTGSYGDVLVLWNREEHSTVAAKIMCPLMTSVGELELWPHFKHPNVLNLLQCIRQPNVVDIFLMPYYPKTLLNILYAEKFRSNPNSFKMVVKWMTEVLLGLEYMHKHDVCHLDLKSDNILITPQSSAVICDFSSTMKCKEPTDDYVLPTYYCPPEAWPLRPDGPRPKADGLAIDIWSVGMLLLFCFSNDWLDSQLWGQTNWWNDMYPLISKCLEYRYFHTLLNRYYPMADIDRGTCAYALNLLKGIFRYEPQDRPTTTQILRHVLFDTTGRNLLDPDPMWTFNHIEVQRQVLKGKLRIITQTALDIVDKLVNDIIQEVDKKEEEKRAQTGCICKRIRAWFQEKCNCC